MPYARIGAESIFYAARGTQGAPLVFVHGAGDSHLLWNGQVAALSDAARTMAIDLPGHGRSDGPARATIAEYARALRDYLDTLAPEQAIIVGASMGGAIAQTVALEYPKRVKGLVLVGTGAKLRVAPAFLNGLQSDFEQTARTLVSNYFAEGAPPALLEKSRQQLVRTGAKVTLNDYAACDAFDARERVAEIQAPALIICGRADRMTPVNYSEYLAAKIAHARLALIENAGHMVMLEQPALFNTELRGWLASIS